MQVLKTCMSLTTLKNIYFACFINANFSKVFYKAIILLLILLLTAKQVLNKVKYVNNFWFNNGVCPKVLTVSNDSTFSLFYFHTIWSC